jgi:O-antigen ligase
MPLRDGHANPLTRLHDRLAVLIGVFVPFTAVPLGSNRASVWLLWTAGLALVACYTFLRSWRLEPALRPRFLAHPALTALALVVPLWAGVQLLPLGPLPGWTDGPALSILPDAGLSGLLRHAGFILLAVLVIEIATRQDRVIRMATLIFAGITAQAIWALTALHLLDDLSLWGPKTAYLGTATGTFINRNSLATFLGLGLVLGAGLLAERGWRQQIRTTRPAKVWERLGLGGVLISLGMVFLLIALIATQSRLGLVASLSGLAIATLAIRFASGVPRLRVAGEALLLFAGTVSIALVLGSGGLSERMLFSVADGESRLAIYSQTLGLIAHRPLLGYGMDAFGAAFEAVRAPPLLAPVTYDLAHNSYLALWAEFGLVAGTAPLLALAGAGLLLLRHIARRDGFPGLACAGLGGLTLGALHSLGDFSLEIPANTYAFVAILALGLGQRRVQRDLPPRPAAKHPVPGQRATA